MGPQGTFERQPIINKNVILGMLKEREIKVAVKPICRAHKRINISSANLCVEASRFNSLLRLSNVRMMLSCENSPPKTRLTNWARGISKAGGRLLTRNPSETFYFTTKKENLCNLILMKLHFLGDNLIQCNWTSQ